MGPATPPIPVLPLSWNRAQSQAWPAAQEPSSPLAAGRAEAAHSRTSQNMAMTVAGGLAVTAEEQNPLPYSHESYIIVYEEYLLLGGGGEGGCLTLWLKSILSLGATFWASKAMLEICWALGNFCIPHGLTIGLLISCRGVDKRCKVGEELGLRVDLTQV